MPEDADSPPQRDWEGLEKGEAPPREWIREALWSRGVGPASYAQPDGYRAAILEQYKAYVEMADRISARRGLTNTFFLTLNSAVFTVIGIFWKDRPPEPSPAVLAVSAKYDVIGLLEERLPASPYQAAEWAALKRGKDWRVYWPLSHVEQWIPILFAAIYVAGAVLVVAS